MEELKAWKQIVEEAARRSDVHRAAVEQWKDGAINKIWVDEDGNICIKYETGNWWHYNDKGEWW